MSAPFAPVRFLRSFSLERGGGWVAHSARVRWVLILYLLVSVLLAAPASLRAAPKLDRVSLGGNSYVRARDWAASRGLSADWVVRDKALRLAGGGTRIDLTLNSHEMQFNGTSVFLSHPVVGRDNGFYVSAFDMETALAPLIRPERAAGGIRTICLDPGHGGKDPGNLEGSQQEKKYTLLLAQELRAQLTKLGFKVVLTRTKDSFVDLDDRSALAKKLGADLFVSLHFNAIGSSKSTVRGAETYCLTPAGASSTNARGVGAGTGAYRGNQNDDQNLLLAYHIQKSLVACLSTEDRGVRRARFAVLRDVSVPAVLIEAGFMSHPSEGKKIFGPAYRKQMAQAIAQGIVAYKQVVGSGA
jgi:N-acetylmuramoyl-L-alanine amidase